MEQDLTLLQNISDTLKEDPSASQRTLAQNANVSPGLMNAILKRFVERGWIMLTNVNARKLAYAVTPAGVSELTERSRNFAKRTFAIANQYNQILEEIIQKAKDEGKESVVLYGKSYIKFLIVYACEKVGIRFEECEINGRVEGNSLVLVGELEDKKIISEAENMGFVNILEVIG